MGRAQDTTPDRSEPQVGRSVSLDQAARLLGVSRRTIYNRIREQRLLTIRTRGGSQRVLLESVERLRTLTEGIYPPPQLRGSDGSFGERRS